jgi:hypothetical protein
MDTVRHRQAGLCWALSVFFCALISLGGVAHSCGYHNSVDLARGMLNWVYPNSLYVRTAVWQAEDAGVLPKRASEPRKDLFAYHRIAMTMRTYGELMTKAHFAPGEMQGLSVLLIESVLWTRFVRTTEGYSVEIHAEGAAPNDVVMVTDDKVMISLVDGTITPRFAREHGLIRLYGSSGSIENVADRLDRVPVAK